jgi:NADH-quinone oxidoreductase subunit G
VWFLEKTVTTCPGCSTGCRVAIFGNKQERKYYRLKPEFDADVNGHWMCDYGRKMYKHCNAESRLAKPRKKGVDVEWNRLVGELERILQETRGKKVALVLTPQYTTEEYTSVLNSSKRIWGALPDVWVWRPQDESVDAFDGILFRGDKNPNTKGLERALVESGAQAKILRGRFDDLKNSQCDLVIVLGPEVEAAYGDLSTAFLDLSAMTKVVYFGQTMLDEANAFELNVPVKVFAEKNGTYINFDGKSRVLKANAPVFVDVQSVEQIFAAVAQRIGQ